MGFVYSWDDKFTARSSKVLYYHPPRWFGALKHFKYVQHAIKIDTLQPDYLIVTYLQCGSRFLSNKRNVLPSTPFLYVDVTGNEQAEVGLKQTARLSLFARCSFGKSILAIRPAVSCVDLNCFFHPTVVYFGLIEGDGWFNKM